MPAISSIVGKMNELLVPSIKETLDLVGNERKINEEQAKIKQLEKELEDEERNLLVDTLDGKF